MTKRDNGGPAYPRAGFSGPGGFGRPENGMTLRDWFAGQVDAGDLQFPSLDAAGEWLGCDAPDPNDVAAVLAFSVRIEAAIRYRKADAMIAERNRR